VKRKVLFGLAAATALFVPLCVAGRGDALRKEISSTRRVTVDGRSFLPDETSPGGVSLLRKELGRLSVRLPDGFELPEEPVPSHPAFFGRLKESAGSQPIDSPRLPEGLTADHTLRLEGEGKPVDLVFGRIGSRGPSIRTRLLSSGWETVSTGEGPRLVHVLQTNRGKETAIVCLDEAEGAFLLFREVGR
jgi:hypothetical protein